MAAMPKQATPKSISSRLASMKFMQRGAAAAAAAGSSPASASPATPITATDDTSGSAKRRKTSHTPSAGAPGAETSSPATALFDHAAIKAAAEEENRRNQAAIERRAAELGDSHWVLEGAANLPAPRGAKAPLRVVQVGFGEIDRTIAADGDNGEDEDDDDPFGMGSSAPAQPRIMRFNIKKPKAYLLQRQFYGDLLGKG